MDSRVKPQCWQNTWEVTAAANRLDPHHEP